MIAFKLFDSQNYNELLAMMTGFYMSEALEQALDQKIIVKLLRDILSGNYNIRGYEIYDDGQLAGFGVITVYYASEVAGINVQLEDLYIKSEFRGKGIGTAYFKMIKNSYGSAARFRLEVSLHNQKVMKLYESLGFRQLGYTQMVLEPDREISKSSR